LGDPSAPVSFTPAGRRAASSRSRSTRERQFHCIHPKIIPTAATTSSIGKLIKMMLWVRGQQFMLVKGREPSLSMMTVAVDAFPAATRSTAL